MPDFNENMSYLCLFERKVYFTTMGVSNSPYCNNYKDLDKMGRDRYNKYNETCSLNKALTKANYTGGLWIFTTLKSFVIR